MAGPINWFSQIVSITKFGLLSIPQRRGAVAATVIGIAGVVTVLVGVLSIAAGFRQAMTVSASPDSAIVLRSGADSEMVSGLSRDQTRIIADSPGVARTAQGPLASAELFVIINIPKRSTGTDANVPLRGVESAAWQVRDNMKIVQGRMFEWGKDEVIVGAGAAREFSGLEVGSKIKVGRYEWPVVGIFSANGGAAESEREVAESPPDFRGAVTRRGEREDRVVEPLRYGVLPVVRLHHPGEQDRVVCGEPDRQGRPDVEADPVEVAPLRVRPVALGGDPRVPVRERGGGEVVRNLAGERIAPLRLVEMAMDREATSSHGRRTGLARGA